LVNLSSDAILEMIAVIIIAALMAYLLPLALIKAGRRAGVSRAQLITLKKWIHVLSLVFAVAGIINALDLGTELELLTIGGIAALVFSLALQSFLASMIAGFLSFGQDTIRHGDLVEVAGDGKGRVVKVNLRNIWVKTDSGALLIMDHTRTEHGRFWNYSALERLEKHFDSRSSIS